MSNIHSSLWEYKYSPTQFDEYVGNESIKDKFNKFIENDNMPHILLHGKAGTGKTTAGKLLIDNFDCDYLYINASDENDINTVRTKIKRFVSSMSFKRWKIVFLDEADALTGSSQRALRNMMETYSNSSRFILTCNYPEKIIEAIQSRCTVFEIYPPSKKEAAKRLVTIMQNEGVEFDLQDVGSIVNAAYPDLRKIISSAQAQSLSGTLEIDAKMKMEQDYMGKLLEVLKSPVSLQKSYKTCRQIIADSKVRSFDELYTYLYDHIYDFTSEGIAPEVTIEIARAMREDMNCVDKEINAVTMLVEILKIKLKEA